MSKEQAAHASGGDGKLKVSYKVHVVHRDRRARLVEGAPPPGAEREAEPKGTIPRISRLLALAHHIQSLLDTGQVQNLADVARLGHITRPRTTQIMNLLLLAPDIQEQILFLPPTTAGGDPVTERGIREVLAESSFTKQRDLWRGIGAAAS